jgi:C_GCAxxG_C_C family probable redox protein
VDLNKLRRYKNKSEFIEEIKRRAFTIEVTHHGCAQAVLKPFLDAFEVDNDLVMMAASPFAGGLALTGNNCGALIGALIAVGLVVGRRNLEEGMEGILSGVRPMRKVARYFERQNKFLNCREITQTDLADQIKSVEFFNRGGLEKCAQMIADVSGFVADILYEEWVRREEF